MFDFLICIDQITKIAIDTLFVILMTVNDILLPVLLFSFCSCVMIIFTVSVALYV